MKSRLTNAAFVGAFFIAFLASYRQYVVPTYDYFGVGWRDPPHDMITTAFLMNVVLGFLVNPVYRRPSQLFLVIQLLVVFLPASIICLNVTRPELAFEQLFELVIALFVGMLIQTLFSGGPAGRPAAQTRVRTRKMLHLLFWFACAMLFAAILSLGDIFSLTDFDSMYEQRDILDERATGALLRYGISWLVSFVIPVLAIAALQLRGARRARLLLFCAMAYFVIFGLTATKTSLFAPIIVLAIYWTLAPTRLSFVKKFVFGFTAIVTIPLVLVEFDFLNAVTPLYVAVANFRIFAVPQLLYVQYFDFFNNHAHTLGSHISLVSSLIRYPYEEPVFLIIGEYFYPGSNMTANAGAWAQDGIAGFGLIGIVLVSILITAIMRVLDRASRGHDPKMVGGAMAMLTLFLCNASIFTTLLSGGLITAIFLLWYTGRPANTGLASRTKRGIRAEVDRDRLLRNPSAATSGPTGAS
jgi:hypothetical protein